MTLVGGVRREEESEGILLCKSEHRPTASTATLPSQKVQLGRQEARKDFNFLLLKFKRQHNRKVGTSQKQRSLQATLIGNSKTLGW